MNRDEMYETNRPQLSREPILILVLPGCMKFETAPEGSGPEKKYYEAVV